MRVCLCSCMNHPRGTTLPEALRGNLFLKVLCWGSQRRSAGLCSVVRGFPSTDPMLVTLGNCEIHVGLCVCMCYKHPVNVSCASFGRQIPTLDGHTRETGGVGTPPRRRGTSCTYCKFRWRRGPAAPFQFREAEPPAAGVGLAAAPDAAWLCCSGQKKL